ncbi:MAG: DUF1203 domain-containing protein [Gemmatimonadetes bacterium]|nr:DUF1203 domain-containing protein [Gemmatimonadota bacterium]
MWITGIDPATADEVRRTLKAPGYGHPATVELARGTGPCRQCLGTFRVGQEERVLFTYRPREEGGTVTAPGPIFVHREPCQAPDPARVPEDLRTLPLLLEARGDGGVVLATAATGGAAVEGTSRRSSLMRGCGTSSHGTGRRGAGLRGWIGSGRRREQAVPTAMRGECPPLRASATQHRRGADGDRALPPPPPGPR